MEGACLPDAEVHEGALLAGPDGPQQLVSNLVGGRRRPLERDAGRLQMLEQRDQAPQASAQTFERPARDVNSSVD